MAFKKIPGFTLIELLIVVVLIAIIGTMAMLSMANGDRRDWQRQEAERLLQLLELASQEAVSRGAPLAVEVFSNGYRFMVEEHGKWTAGINDAVFQPRAMPANIFLELELDKKAVILNRKEMARPFSEAHIVLTPDGDIMPFRIKIGLAGDDDIFLVANSVDGGLSMAANPVGGY